MIINILSISLILMSAVINGQDPAAAPSDSSLWSRLFSFYSSSPAPTPPVADNAAPFAGPTISDTVSQYAGTALNYTEDLAYNASASVLEAGKDAGSAALHKGAGLISEPGSQVDPNQSYIEQAASYINLPPNVDADSNTIFGLYDQLSTLLSPTPDGGTTINVPTSDMLEKMKPWTDPYVDIGPLIVAFKGYEAYEKAKNTVGDVKDKVQGAAGNVKDGVVDSANKVGDVAGNIADGVKSLFGHRPSSPGKPTLKHDPNNLDPETVTIKWDPPLYDGGSKITGYLVEHKRTGSPHWVKASPIKVRQTQLTVCGLEPGWRYQFRVSAENDVGLSDPSPLSEPLAIFVHRSAAIAPYFVNELYDLAVLENEKVEFNVSFEGVPSPKISWYKDGLELFSNRCQKVSTEGCLSRFIIYEANISDESEIKCTATNKVGYAVTRAYLKVEAPPTIRLPRQYEDGLIFEKGELIRLKVSVVGQPYPFVYWSFNGERIDPSSSRHEMEYVDGTAILKVRDAQRTDRGEYQIQAVNTLGEDVASILITIANRPQPPTNVSVARVESNSVTLEWMKPEDDGGCEIGSYIIEYYKTGWNVWLKAATSRQLTITLDDLIEASQYKFRIKAENPYGVSDPSHETETIFIPDVKKRIFRLEDVPKHQQESDIMNFPLHHQPDFALQTASETDCSGDNLDHKFPTAPEKPERKKIKKPTNGLPANHNDSDLFRRATTPTRQPSPNGDDLSRTSSELMLVLVPSADDLLRSRGKGSLDGVSYRADKEASNLMTMPPPISLSAPELGSELQFFKPLHRNCVSSTEILHESTIARFYKELQEESGIEKLREQLHISPRRKHIENRIDGEVITSKFSLDFSQRNSSTPTDLLRERSPFNGPTERSSSSMSRSIPFEDNLHMADLLLENTADNFVEDDEHYDRSGWRSRPNTLPDTSLPPIYSPESSNFTQGRYSPLSGTFHYPDLFMESLTKSPQFKPTTTRPFSEVMASGNRAQFDSFVGDLHDYDPSYADADHYGNSYWNEDEESESESTSEDDLDDDYENDTYHPRDRSPLSFEQALAISNPKRRSASPTNDLFLESESLYDDGLHYFNRNYDFQDDNRRSAEEEASKRPKSILKYSAHNELEITNSPASTMSRGSSLSRMSSASPLRLPKKQVRIEEPSHGGGGGEHERAMSVDDSEDTSHVIINHYSDIVRQYSQTQKKPHTKMYLTYDELKAAAQMNDDNCLADDSNTADDVSATAMTKEDICDNFHHLPVPQRIAVRSSRSPSPAQANPKLYAAQVRHNVHFFFDFFVDLMLFTLACWLFCFKDERLAIPVIVLLVYRQLYEKIKGKMTALARWRTKIE